MSHEGIGAFSPKVGAGYTRGGGPAFPILDEGACVIYGGMTLRDYFAAKAMQPMLDFVFSKADEDAPNRIPDSNIAKRAYAVADAMLKARVA